MGPQGLGAASGPVCQFLLVRFPLVPFLPSTLPTAGHCSRSFLHGFERWNESCPFEPAASPAASLCFLLILGCKESSIISTLTGKGPNFRDTESTPSFMSSEWQRPEVSREPPMKPTFLPFCQTELPRGLCQVCNPSARRATVAAGTIAAKAVYD